MARQISNATSGAMIRQLDKGFGGATNDTTTQGFDKKVNKSVVTNTMGD